MTALLQEAHNLSADESRSPRHKYFHDRPVSSMRFSSIVFGPCPNANLVVLSALKFACWASLCGARFGQNRWLAEDALARINAQIEERAEHAQATGHQKRRLPVDELNHITNCDGR